MAIKLIANYSKKIGLPGFSSHQFSVSVETELLATADIPAEAGNLYHLLQSNVDQQLLTTGFVPPKDYGFEPQPGNPTPASAQNAGNGRRAAAWRCTDKQKDLILKVVAEHQLDKDEVEILSNQRFGKGVRQLNKVEASGLIDELLETYGGKNLPADGALSNGSSYSGAKERRVA
jgi:hypothetical protein